MDGGGRFGRSLKAWLGKRAEAWAQHRAYHSAKRRARSGQFTIRRGLGSSFALLFLTLSGAAGFFIGGHDEAFRREFGMPHDAIANWMGFGVSQIAVDGNAELLRDEVISLSGLDPRVSLPFLDPKSLQARLLRVPLIAEASVTKLYPDRLRIDIRERVPYALWQMEGDVKVISVDGTAIEDLNDARFLRLPHVVGKDANHRVKDYVALVEAVPALSGQIRAGTLVAGRRWNLKLLNGVDLFLPEERAAEALKAFWAIEQTSRISERAVLAIDLRLPDRLVVRLTEEGAAQHAETVVQRIKKMGGKV
ncbi:FtsQ Cell division septal protein [Rhabdaerophilaceae bacterium]